MINRFTFYLVVPKLLKLQDNQIAVSWSHYAEGNSGVVQWILQYSHNYTLPDTIQNVTLDGSVHNYTLNGNILKSLNTKLKVPK